MKRHAVFFILCISVFLLPAITSASVAAPSCRFVTNLTLGSRGGTVVCLQRNLLASGYSIPAGATGYFGYQTRAAVSAWQKTMRVSPTYGYFGPLSRKAFARQTLSKAVTPSPVVISAPVSVMTTTSPAPTPAFTFTLAPSPVMIAGGTDASVAAVQAGVAPIAPVPEQPAPATSSATPATISVPVPEPVPVVTPVPVAETIVSASTPVPLSVSSSLSGTVVLPDELKWSCDFENDYCGFYEQSKVEPDGRRSSFVSVARSGGSAVKLTTLPGDSQVHGSGDWERNDLSLSPSAAYCNEGQEEWWALSVLFPEDYVVPTNSAVMDFHHNASGGQANFHITSGQRGLEVRGFYGDVSNPQEYRTELGQVERNTWYDFVYHVKWSSGADGFMTVWMNGKKMLSHSGPTLYPNISCYLKLANYHNAFGASSSIIFDRVLRGTSASAVAFTPLE